VDLQELFVPVANYEERSITLRSGESKKIDVSSLGVHWDLREKYEFVANANYCGMGTQHSYTLSDSANNIIETITFSVTAASSTFKRALEEALENSLQIKNLVTIDASQFEGPTGKITATARAKGVKYRHEFSFDLNGFGGYWPFPYVHPGNLITRYRKYDRERIKLMMIYPDFYKSTVLSGCNCIDQSGDMRSNKKWIEYAYDDQHFMVNNPGTPITVSPVLNVNPLGTQWTWDANSPEHAGYYLKVGDLVSLSGNPLLRGIITEIQGYYIEVDTVLGDLPLPSNSQTVSRVYAPNSIQWRKIGDFYVHTAAQDVNDDDYLYIETLWLRNPHKYDLPIKILLAS
jgi:hypothetical protein